MIHTTLALALVLVLGFNASAQEKKKKTDKELLMGSWKLIFPGEPTVEITLTFAKKDKLVVVAKTNGNEVKTDGTWELKGKKLSTTIKIPNGPEKKEELTIETLDEKRLIFKNSQGILDKFDRVVEKMKVEKKK